MLECNLKFLDPVPKIDYELDDYRLSYNDSCQELDYLKMHDHSKMSDCIDLGWKTSEENRS